MEPRCQDCKFFRKLKHNFVQYKGHEESYCCVAFEYCLEDGESKYDSFILEVGLEGCCELFNPKEKRNIE